MAIEHLLNSKDLYFEQLRIAEEKTHGNAEKKLTGLRNTKLYDEKHDQWIWWIDDNHEIGKASRPADAQLLSVIAETLLYGDTHGHQRLTELKKTNLYDGERDQWRWWIDDNQEVGDPARPADAQLLFVIAKTLLYGQTRGQQKLTELKKTNLYDGERDQWRAWIGDDQEIGGTHRTAEAQLLSVIAETLLYGDTHGHQRLTELKKTNLYDDAYDQWRCGIRKNQELVDTFRTVDDQLLSIIAETLLYGQTHGQNKLATLKQTKLYDGEHDQWIWLIEENQELVDSDRTADAQLSYIWLETLLEPKGVLTKPEDPLPLTRRF